MESGEGLECEERATFHRRLPVRRRRAEWALDGGPGGDTVFRRCHSDSREDVPSAQEYTEKRRMARRLLN